MEVKDITQAIFQYGGTVIMAVLFIWVFVEDKKKNQQMLEDNTTMLKALTESNKTLTESNNNIAKALDIISNNLIVIDKKVDLLREEKK